MGQEGGGNLNLEVVGEGDYDLSTLLLRQLLLYTAMLRVVEVVVEL